MTGGNWARTSLGSALGPARWLLCVSAAALIVSGAVGEVLFLPGACGSPGTGIIPGRIALLLGIVSPVALASSWLVMLAAMMPPLLVQPVRHIQQSSFPERRFRALSLFALAYTCVWLLAGSVLVPASLLVRIIVPDPWVAALLLILAIVWSCAPASQGARNACHRMRRIGAFGWKADRDCLIYGLTVGSSCLCSCWPWMLATLALDRFHPASMVATTLWLLLERLDAPQLPVWQRPPALSVLGHLWKRQKVLGSRYPRSSMTCHPETFSPTSALSRLVSL